MRHRHGITVALALLLALGAPSAIAADGKPAAAKKKPVATKHTAKPRAHAASPARKRAGKRAAKKAPPAAHAKRPMKAPLPTARASTPPATTNATVRAAPARSLPPPQTATFIPLGPERFYPNGIPELRPEFMHPLPEAQVTARQEAAAREATFEERRSWFAAPQ
jgi:hypothetical protein